MTKKTIYPNIPRKSSKTKLLIKSKIANKKLIKIIEDIFKSIKYPEKL